METKQSLQQVLADLCRRMQRMESKLDESQNSRKEWLDQQEACLLLHISKRTLSNFRDRGLLTFSKIGRKVFYSHDDIDHYLYVHKVRKGSAL